MKRSSNPQKIKVGDIVEILDDSGWIGWIGLMDKTVGEQRAVSFIEGKYAIVGVFSYRMSHLRKVGTTRKPE